MKIPPYPSPNGKILSSFKMSNPSQVFEVNGRHQVGLVVRVVTLHGEDGAAQRQGDGLAVDHEVGQALGHKVSGV